MRFCILPCRAILPYIPDECHFYHRNSPPPAPAGSGLLFVRMQVVLRNSILPRRSRGFCRDGQSPLILATRVASRWYGLSATKDDYLLPVNGFRSPPLSVDVRLCSLLIDVLYISVFLYLFAFLSAVSM